MTSSSPLAPNDLFSELCKATQRGPGGRCPRRALKGQPYCRRHMSQPPALALSPAHRDVLATGVVAWRAKMRMRIGRGELSRFPQGRKKRWPIPRPWRFKLSEADEA